MNIMKWKGLDVDPMIIRESVITKADISQIETNFNESTQESGITVLYPRIEAIHAGRTRNYNHYTAEKLKGDYELKSGVYSWTQPYPKPVIHNHDVETEATGRVHSATFTEFTAAGRPGIMVTPKISQEKAIKDILEGRLLTVSIGATTNAAVCSICGTDIINEGFCGHMRGEEYEGQTAEWIAGDLWFDELSWVNVPADPDAMVVGNGMTHNALATGENTTKTTIDGSKISATSITTSQISANRITDTKISTATIAGLNSDGITTAVTDSANTTLTGEDGVVKSVSESTEKEEENVEVTDLNPEVTPEQTPETTTEAPEASTLETTTEEVKQEEAEQAPEQTQEEVTAPADTTTEEAPAKTEEEAPVVTEDTVAELAKAKADLKDALDTIDDLKTANLQLAKAQQESAVGFLVDLRMAIGKEANREEAVEKFASRSLESLNDSIADILVEKPALGTTRTVETVVKPEGVSIAESKTLATDQVKVISNEDAILSLLRGK